MFEAVWAMFEIVKHARNMFQNIGQFQTKINWNNLEMYYPVLICWDRALKTHTYFLFAFWWWQSFQLENVLFHRQLKKIHQIFLWNESNITTYLKFRYIYHQKNVIFFHLSWVKLKADETWNNWELICSLNHKSRFLERLFDSHCRL